MQAYSTSLYCIRITHATPSGAYAHTASREWEGYDGKAYTREEADQGCKDIAMQLIEDNHFINVYITI